MEWSITTEFAIAYKDVLSPNTYKLLNTLIADLKSTLPPEEQIYKDADNKVLIYNLFRGNYHFSYSQYIELCKCLFDRDLQDKEKNISNQQHEEDLYNH